MKIAYLNLKSHPRGNHMLYALSLTKYCPSLVIEEVSTLAEKSAKTLTKELEQVKDEPLPMKLDDILQTKDILHILVENHNDVQTENALRAFKPDFIVLGDTRIIKPNIIQLAAKGVINVHPGYLPDVRGNNPYIWSLIHGLPSGCSVHYIDERIDTGPLLLRKKLHPERYPSYQHYLVAINKLCGELLDQAVTQIIEKNLQAIPQSEFQLENEVFDTFSAAPSEIKNKVKKMFVDQSITRDEFNERPA